MLAVGGELVFERTLERRARFATLHKIGKIGGIVEKAAPVSEPQHGDHHQVAN
jgi:hypothetical protein